jgi:hypothetical protein
VIATIFTLLFNSMAAFALSKYRFSGRKDRVPADPVDADGAADDRAGAELSSSSPSSAC